MNHARCLVAPHPDLQQRLKEGLARLRATADPMPRVVRSAAAMRVPLRGTPRVVVVLVEFGDQPMAQSQQHFSRRRESP